jgi:hypothetical protein
MSAKKVLTSPPFLLFSLTTGILHLLALGFATCVQLRLR